MSFITDHHESPAVTFAEPGATRSLGQVALDTLQGIGQAVSDPYVNPKPYGDLFWAAERSTRLTGNVVSESASREEAYDRRIKTIKAATGLDLENPERGGYQIDARRQIAQEVRAGGMTSVDTAGGIPEYQRRIFDQKVAELQKAHPDLSFGDLDAEARQIAHGSSVDLAKAATAPASGPASLAVQFAGGVLGSRRDPIFIGSMLAGPETAAARTMFGRIAGAAMRSGLYNAGISAMEQPAVQAWREKIGLEHGIVPAIEDVGFAFGLGLIPGAVVQGIKEGFRAPMGRVLAGHPEPGDIEAVKAALPIPEREAAALRVGEESVAADRATLTIQPPKGVPEPLHDDMMAAALKRADQPDAPSPEAVQAVKAIEAYHGSPYSFDAFDAGKIGAGQGAQSYGHGLYFAENKAVAADYSKMFPKGFSPENLITETRNKLGTDDPAKIFADIEKRKSEGLGISYGQMYAGALERIKSPQDIGNLYARGNTYQVRIRADQEKMLDWDKPLSEQSEFVRQAIEKIPREMRDAVEARLEERGISTDPSVVTGGDFVRAISSHADDFGASENLRDAGIPGIKYLDQGSRGAGEGSRNFVVFNDKDVEITHKNGQPVERQVPAEVEQRITEAAPKTEAEAHAIADQALDDIGRREGMGSLRDRMGEAEAERAEVEAAVRTIIRSTAAEPEKPARARGDVLDKVPWVDDAGNPKLMTAKGAAAVGERETTLSMLVRSCK